MSAELDAEIDAALSALNGAIAEAKHHDDPLWMPLSALSAFLRAMRQLYADAAVSLREAQKPARDEDMRRAVVAGISAWGAGAVRALGWRNVLVGAGMLAVALAVGAGGGYWFRGAAPLLIGVRAGAERCENRSDGSRLCWIPVLERLPTTRGTN